VPQLPFQISSGQSSPVEHRWDDELAIVLTHGAVTARGMGFSRDAIAVKSPVGLERGSSKATSLYDRPIAAPFCANKSRLPGSETLFAAKLSLRDLSWHNRPISPIDTGVSLCPVGDPVTCRLLMQLI
jgi:hypothetical protein